MKISLLFRNVRFYVLVFSVLLSLVIFFLITSMVPLSSQALKITQVYAFTASIFLYLALLAGPFCYNFKTSINPLYLKARRAIGVSVFYFGFLHYVFALFGVIGGLTTILSLPSRDIIAIIFSYLALFILFLMAITSFDFVIKFMTFKKWKLLHRLVYIGAFFTLAHALILGSHFKNFNYVSLTSIALLIFLFSLEGRRILSNLKDLTSKKR